MGVRIARNFPDGVGKTSFIWRSFHMMASFVYAKPNEQHNKWDKILDLPISFPFGYQENEKMLIDKVYNVGTFIKHSRKSDEHSILVVDETDLMGSISPSDLAKESRRLRDMLSDRSTFILVNRDFLGEIETRFANQRSDVRSAFDEHMVLRPLWQNSIEVAKDLLCLRLGLKSSVRGDNFPFTSSALSILTEFSIGNTRELIRNTRRSLIEGVINEKPPPLGEDFIGQLLIDLPESKISNNRERELLLVLSDKPLSPSDKSLKPFGSPTTITRILSKLEDRCMVKRDHYQSGKKQVYSITRKAQLILERQ